MRTCLPTTPVPWCSAVQRWDARPRGPCQGPQQIFEVITGMVDPYSDEPFVVNDSNVEAVAGHRQVHAVKLDLGSIG